MISNNTKIGNFIEALYEEIYDELEKSERTGKPLDLLRVKKSIDRQLDDVINTLDIINEAIRDWSEENGEDPNLR